MRELHFLSQNCTIIFYPLDHGITSSFKYYYNKQLLRETTAVIDHKLLHDAAIRTVNVLDALHSMKNHGAGNTRQ
jgi:hypothetical protein